LLGLTETFSVAGVDPVLSDTESQLPPVFVAGIALKLMGVPELPTVSGWAGGVEAPV
jgi:hypothetical protein